MTDYRRPITFGFFLEPDGGRPASTVAAGMLADTLGFDFLGVQDHPYQPRFLDTWTLLSTIGAKTSNIRLLPDVANLALRPPAVLAKAAASLDLLTSGRVELGLGAGLFWDAIAAMGGSRRTPGEAVDALAEAIEVIRLWWSDQPAVSYNGTHYSLRGAHPGPAPAHDIGIWLGAYGPRMLELTGRKANGWLPSVAFLPPDDLPRANARIDQAATDEGRDPSTITRIYHVGGQQPTRDWVDLCTGWALEVGMDGFAFAGPPTETNMRQISDEIAPAVRDAVAKERAR